MLFLEMMKEDLKNSNEYYLESAYSGMLITPKRIGIAMFVVLCIGLGIASLFLDAAILAGGVVVVLFALLIFLYPYFGLLMLYLDIIVAPAVIWPQLGPLHPDAALGGLLLTSVLFHKKIKGEPFVLFGERMTILMTLFLVALISTIPTSVWPSDSISWVMNFLTTFIFYVLIVNVLTTEKRLIGFMWLCIASGGYTAVSSALAYFEGNLTVAQGIERAQSLAGADPNTLAVTLVISIPFMAFAVVWAKGKFLKFVALLLVVSSIVTISLTGSRAGIMGLCTVLFLLWLMSKHKILTLATFIAVVAIGWFALPEQYKQRYSTLTGVTKGEVDESTQARYDAWHAGLRMFMARPVFGIGVGEFPVAYASGDYSSRGYWLRAHSMYVQIIAELGVVGVLTFGPLVYYMMRQNFRLRKRMRVDKNKDRVLWGVSQAITCSTGALFVTSISGHSLFRMHWYWCCALTVVLWRLYQDMYREPDKQPAIQPNTAAHLRGKIN